LPFPTRKEIGDYPSSRKREYPLSGGRRRNGQRNCLCGEVIKKRKSLLRRGFALRKKKKEFKRSIKRGGSTGSPFNKRRGGKFLRKGKKRARSLLSPLREKGGGEKKKRRESCTTERKKKTYPSPSPRGGGR